MWKFLIALTTQHTKFFLFFMIGSFVFILLWSIIGNVSPNLLLRFMSVETAGRMSLSIAFTCIFLMALCIAVLLPHFLLSQFINLQTISNNTGSPVIQKIILHKESISASFTIIAWFVFILGYIYLLPMILSDIKSVPSTYGIIKNKQGTTMKNTQNMQYGKIVQFRENEVLQFPDFRINYLGKTNQNVDSNPNLTYTWYNFVVTALDNKEIPLRWSSGTGRIAPINFEVGNTVYQLELKYSEKDNKQLADNEMIISIKNPQLGNQTNQTNMTDTQQDLKIQLESAYNKVRAFISSKGDYSLLNTVFEENSDPSLPPLPSDQWSYVLSTMDKGFPDIQHLHYISSEQDGEYAYYFAWTDALDKPETHMNVWDYVFHKNPNGWKLTGYSFSNYVAKGPSSKETDQIAQNTIASLKKQVAENMKK